MITKEEAIKAAEIVNQFLYNQMSENADKWRTANDVLREHDWVEAVNLLESLKKNYLGKFLGNIFPKLLGGNLNKFNIDDEVNSSLCPDSGFNKFRGKIDTIEKRGNEICYRISWFGGNMWFYECELVKEEVVEYEKQ
jgi:hypothetical protein